MQELFKYALEVPTAAALLRVGRSMHTRSGIPMHHPAPVPARCSMAARGGAGMGVGVVGVGGVVVVVVAAGRTAARGQSSRHRPAQPSAVGTGRHKPRAAAYTASRRSQRRLSRRRRGRERRMTSAPGPRRRRARTSRPAPPPPRPSARPSAAAGVRPSAGPLCDGGVAPRRAMAEAAQNVRSSPGMEANGSALLLAMGLWGRRPCTIRRWAQVELSGPSRFYICTSSTSARKAMHTSVLLEASAHMSCRAGLVCVFSQVELPAREHRGQHNLRYELQLDQVEPGPVHQIT